MTPTTVTELAVMGGDRFVAYNAWLSTGKHTQAYTCDEEAIRKVIYFLIRGARRSKPSRRPHSSPFGHPQMSVLVEDIALYAAEQWLRHRTQNFSKDSFRYGQLVDGDAPILDISSLVYLPAREDVRTQVGYPGDYTFPRLLDTDPEAVDKGLAIAHELSLQSLHAYREMLRLGWAPELARGYLPTATFTTFTATASLRNWLNFLGLRATEPELESQAQLEIREPADKVEQLIATHFPITYEMWNILDRPTL